MSRLTEKTDSNYTLISTEENATTNAIQKLGRYEDLEEQGTLLIIPCKVNDVVYYIADIFGYKNKVLRCTVDEYLISSSGIFMVLNVEEDWCYLKCFREVSIEEFGKTIFLTNEETEQARI